ncbi:hypothetical protein GC194_13860 [bacterium]|nr:hypothetical protein [bacterium]
MKRKWSAALIYTSALLGAIAVWLSLSKLDLSLDHHSTVLPGEATFDGIDIGKRTSAYFTHLLLPFACTFLLATLLIPQRIFKNRYFKKAISGIFIISILVYAILLLSETSFGYPATSLLWLVLLLCFFLVKPNRWRKPVTIKWKLRVIVYVGVIILPIPWLPKILLLGLSHWFVRRLIVSGRVNAHFLSNKIYPAFILIGGCLIYLSPAFVDTFELFENANPANAMMRVFKFHEIPFVDFFSSHLLSEQIPLYLYSLINGYQAQTDALVWQHLFFPFAWLTYYYFLKKAINSGSWSFGILLLFPFVQFLLPASYWLALVSVFIMYRYFKNPGFKTILFNILWTVFLLFWRIDIAAAHIPALAGVAIIHLVMSILNQIKHKNNAVSAQRIVWQWLLVGGATILFVASVFYSLNYYYEGKIAGNALQALDYLSASQAHAYSKIAPNTTSWVFIAHHYIFPCVVMLLFILTIKQWNIRGKNQSNQFLNVAILFLSLYYFFNASRGLVRHGFIEGSDRALSSFFYLIVTLFVVKKAAANRRPWVLVLTATGLIILAKYGGHSTAIPFIDQLATAASADLTSSQTQAIEAEKIQKKKQATLEISQYLNANLTSAQTFFDFSNTPMLYFYAQRRVPSYFNQSLQNEMTHRIQLSNIDEMRAMDIPLVVFSHFPDNWWDNTDGVPNAIRYEVLAHWIYNNYQPDTLVAGYQIWNRNNNIPNIKTGSKVSYPRTWNLKWYPSYYLLPRDSKKRQTVAVNEQVEKIYFEPDTCKIGDVLQITGQADTEEKVNAQLVFSKNSEVLGTFQFFVGKHDLYQIPIWTQYNWHLQQPDLITITFDHPVSISSASIIENWYEY